jgi:hypothetical protein
LREHYPDLVKAKEVIVRKKVELLIALQANSLPLTCFNAPDLIDTNWVSVPWENNIRCSFNNGGTDMVELKFPVDQMLALKCYRDKVLTSLNLKEPQVTAGKQSSPPHIDIHQTKSSSSYGKLVHKSP